MHGRYKNKISLQIFSVCKVFLEIVGDVEISSALFKMLHEHFEIFPRFQNSSDFVSNRNRIIGTVKMKYSEGEQCDSGSENCQHETVTTTPPQQSTLDSLNIEMLNIPSNDHNEVFRKERDLGTQSKVPKFTRE